MGLAAVGGECVAQGVRPRGERFRVQHEDAVRVLADQPGDGVEQVAPDDHVVVVLGVNGDADDAHRVSSSTAVSASSTRCVTSSGVRPVVSIMTVARDW